MCLQQHECHLGLPLSAAAEKHLLNSHDTPLPLWTTLLMDLPHLISHTHTPTHTPPTTHTHTHTHTHTQNTHTHTHTQTTHTHTQTTHTHTLNILACMQVLCTPTCTQC